ncbi:MAG: sugar ABC transporter permease [Treponema sp.]|jgi:multiple sugar transport system permease protein|nr:sugar ABC transporter permease [Treponema sp.]
MKSPEKLHPLQQRQSLTPYFFLLPAAMLILVFNIFPLLMSFMISTMDMQISFSSARFVGIKNYIDALADRRFINSVGVTLKFTLLELPVQTVLGLFLSAMLTKNTTANKILRSIYFLPIICSATAIGIMWNMILHSNIGLITYWIRAAGSGRVNFLNTPGTALYIVLFVTVWRTFGISIIIMVASMQNVPADYYQAAEIDGAGKIRQFFFITLPSIMPAFWFLLMTRAIGSLQIFDIVYTLTGGGPNFTTETLVTYIYRRAVTMGGNMGYATAISEFLFVFIMFITFIQYRIMTKTEQ